MQKERRKNKLTGLLRDWRLYLLMVPSLVYLIIFAYVPMYGVQIAFRNFSVRKGIWGSDWVGLEHFKRFLTYPNLKMLLFNTMGISLYGLATFPCSIIFALMINEVQNKKFKKSVYISQNMCYNKL